MRQAYRIMLAALLSGMMAAVAAQGLPGATVKKDDAPAGKNAPSRDGDKGGWRERCKQNPQECENKKAEFQKQHEECRANPEKCKADRAAKREERCKANPQQCEAVKKKMQERREQCKADPENAVPKRNRVAKNAARPIRNAAKK